MSERIHLRKESWLMACNIQMNDPAYATDDVSRVDCLSCCRTPLFKARCREQGIRTEKQRRAVREEEVICGGCGILVARILTMTIGLNSKGPVIRCGDCYEKWSIAQRERRINRLY